MPNDNESFKRKFTNDPTDHRYVGKVNEDDLDDELRVSAPVGALGTPAVANAKAADLVYGPTE